MALHCAACSDNKELVALLLDRGTDMNIVDQVPSTINIDEYLHVHTSCICYDLMVWSHTNPDYVCYVCLWIWYSHRMVILASALRRSMGV